MNCVHSRFSPSVSLIRNCPKVFYLMLPIHFICKCAFCCQLFIGCLRAFHPIFTIHSHGDICDPSCSLVHHLTTLQELIKLYEFPLVLWFIEIIIKMLII